MHERNKQTNHEQKFWVILMVLVCFKSICHNVEIYLYIISAELDSPSHSFAWSFDTIELSLFVVVSACSIQFIFQDTM